MLLGLLALAASLVFGVLGAFEFLYPELFDILPFHKIRPLHVSLAVFAWIFLTAVGGVYYYLPNLSGLTLFSNRAAGWHFWIFLVTGLAILGAYLLGRFGGREYWEFPPAAGPADLFHLDHVRGQLLQDSDATTKLLAGLFLDVGHRYRVLSF